MTSDESALITICLSELQKLQSLIGFTYWRPEEGIDDPESVCLVRRELQPQYIKELKKISRIYVEGINKLRTESDVARNLL